METVGSNIVQIPKIPVTSDGVKKTSSTTTTGKEDKDFVGVREVGGSMSPLWPSYYSPYKPVKQLSFQ